jgi:hypothetical protein
MNERKNRKHFDYQQYDICLVPVGEADWHVNVIAPTNENWWVDVSVGTFYARKYAFSHLQCTSTATFTSIAEALHVSVSLIQSEIKKTEGVQLSIDFDPQFAQSPEWQAADKEFQSLFARGIRRLTEFNWYKK